MPAVNVNIQPEIISWALSQTQEEKLGDKLMNNITQWLNGTKTPTFNQIEDFSKKANIPLGYFFLQTPPVEQIELLEYRTVDSIQLANPSRNLRNSVKIFFMIKIKIKNKIAKRQINMIKWRKNQRFFNIKKFINIIN